jgi:hypothetical protein
MLCMVELIQQRSRKQKEWIGKKFKRSERARYASRRRVVRGSPGKCITPLRTSFSAKVSAVDFEVYPKIGGTEMKAPPSFNAVTPTIP